MNEIINTITDGLFSVFVTLGSIPIIRCQKGTAAEFVAEVNKEKHSKKHKHEFTLL
jgi:hypothetical protein